MYIRHINTWMHDEVTLKRRSGFDIITAQICTVTLSPYAHIPLHQPNTAQALAWHCTMLPYNRQSLHISSSSLLRPAIHFHSSPLLTTQLLLALRLASISRHLCLRCLLLPLPLLLLLLLVFCPPLYVAQHGRLPLPHPALNQLPQLSCLVLAWKLQCLGGAAAGRRGRRSSEMTIAMSRATNSAC
jgi:hypothetical protein